MEIDSNLKSRKKKFDEDEKDSEDANADRPLVLKLKLKAPTDIHESMEVDDEDKDVNLDKKKKKKKKKHKKEKKKKREEERAKGKLREEAKDVVSAEMASLVSDQKAPKRDSLLHSSAPSPKKVVLAEAVTDTPKAVPVPKPPLPAAPILPGARDRRKSNKKLEGDEPSALQRTLDYFQSILQRRDSNGFFAYPVTDAIAPLYSQVIKKPMDFSTMRDKIDNAEYDNLTQYKVDLKLLCNNAMTYNHSDTVYHKEARKLMSWGLKQMTKDKLVMLRKTMPFMQALTDDELGLKDAEMIAETNGTPLAAHRGRPSSPKPGSSKFEAVPDNLTPEAILAQAQAAAKHASSTLTLRKPNSKMGFLRRRDDGTITLNFLNPDSDGILSDNERIVDLGTLTGKLKDGSGALSGFKEDKRNKAVAVNYLTYGPFGSYAPVYDSSNANLSKEDSDLLLSTYGDEVGLQYARSLEEFVSNAGDYAVEMVDSLLDILTDKEHSKTGKPIRQKEKEQEAEAEKKKQEEKAAEEKREAEKRAEAELEAEMQLLSDMGSPVDSADELQKQLDATAQLLRDLESAQLDRLGQSTPHLSTLSGADESETDIAKKVTSGLTDLMKLVPPEHVTSFEAMQRALGISEGQTS